MADETDIATQLAPYLRLLQGQQPAYAPPAPVDRSVASLLGEAVGGGTTGLAPADRESAGQRALLNFGLNMLAGSGPSVVPRGFGQIFAQGAGGAEQSLAGSEAVAASRLAAQQAYEEKQQELRLNAIKEAIPLLKLQQAQKLANMPSSIGGGSGTPGAGASIGQVGSPDEFAQKFTPIAQTIADQTGLPVDYVLAQAAHETGFGKSPAAANNNFFGITDPKTGKLATYATPQEGAAAYVQLMQSDRYKSVPRSGTPAEIGDRMALAGYNPNVPAKDKTDSYGARIGGVASMLARPKPGGAPAAAPTAAAPPAPSVAPATAPPVITDATGGQVAGPGAPSAARTQAPSPAVPGDVNAIIAGMVGAGADPTTLAPPSTPPAPVQVAGPGAPTPSTPAEPPPFNYVFHAPPLGVLPGGNLTPDEARVVNDARNSYSAAIKAAAFADDPGKARAEAEATLQKTLDSELGIRAGRTKEAADKLATWVADDYKQQQAVHAKAVEDFYKNRDQQRELEKVRVTADEARKTADATQIGARNQKLLGDLDVEASSARGAISELDGLKALSDNVKTPSVWATIPWGNTTVGNRMAQAGLLDKGELGATQMLQTGISGVIKTLRQGMAMGSLSDRDLTFIEGMGPNLYQDQNTRSAVIGYLKQAQQAKIRFNVEVNKEMSRPGTNMAEAIDRAQQTMEKKYPIVPQMPQDLWDHQNDPDPAWKARRLEWAADNNVTAGTLWRTPGGGLRLVPSQGQK